MISVYAGLFLAEKDSEVIELIHFTVMDLLQRHHDRCFHEFGVAVSFTCLSYFQ